MYTDFYPEKTEAVGSSKTLINTANITQHINKDQHLSKPQVPYDQV
jgi:hypothetical protein